MRALNVTVGIFVLCLASTAVAQVDYMGAPTYGTFTVNGGFTPDPQAYAVVAGGTQDSSQLMTAAGPCNAGLIAGVPDIRVMYSPTGYPLRFYVDQPDTDTTLAINAPDGTWYCNDDAVGLQPVIDFATPMPGQYDIFVGTFAQGTNPSVNLMMTELPQANGPVGAMGTPPAEPIPTGLTPEQAACIAQCCSECCGPEGCATAEQEGGCHQSCGLHDYDEYFETQ